MKQLMALGLSLLLLVLGCFLDASTIRNRLLKASALGFGYIAQESKNIEEVRLS